MNKYYVDMEYYTEGISGQLMENESILWEGRPLKKAFTINSALPMMPIALLWLCFDGACSRFGSGSTTFFRQRSAGRTRSMQ